MRTLRIPSFPSAVTLAVALALVALGFASACGGDVDLGGKRRPGSRDPVVDEPDLPLVPATKLDVLFAVDNSGSMHDKQVLLSKSVGKFLARFVRPRCVDPERGGVVGESVDGVCRVGVLEHAPIRDIHVGVISSSLGNGGAGSRDPNEYSCRPSEGRTNDRGHLLRDAPNGGIVANAEKGFLAYAPGGGPGTISDFETLATDAVALVVGVGQTGCGLEAQLESLYRFLNQPDPSKDVTVDESNRAVYSKELDVELLTQRAAFLRPDSAVAIVLVTDEDDSMVDPLSIGGYGWAYASRFFPGSRVVRQESSGGTTAPRGTSVCDFAPASRECTSCWFAELCDPNEAACAALKNDPSCRRDPLPDRGGADGPRGVVGYYGPTEDSLNTRFRRMKQRYGVDPQYPLERYVRALTNREVPNRETEHDPAQRGMRSFLPPLYVHAATCTNPLFASTLPAQPGDELCDLPVGTRSRRLISLAVIAGVPPDLVVNPNPSSADWTKILGANPDAFDYSGIDPHMIQSVEPRAGLAAPSSKRGDNGGDLIHGREWDTRGVDLQYACTFPVFPTFLCAVDDRSCDCADMQKNPPLCSDKEPKVQVRGRAYPSIRPLTVAKRLGDRAVVGSVCTADPPKGYDATLIALANHVAGVLAK